MNQPISVTAPLAQIPASVSSVPLLAANGIRKGASFYNNSSNNLYLACGITASTSAFTAKVPPSGLYELPTVPVWQGAVSGVWDGTSGNVQITEFE